MGADIGLLNNRKAKAIAYTMSLLSRTSEPLIEGVIKYVVYKIKPKLITEFKRPAIYRAKNAYMESREKVITLSGLYSQLYGREKKHPKQEPFGLIVNVDDGELKNGYVWYSPTGKRSYQIDDLDYFVLTETGFTPYTHIGNRTKRTRK